MRRIVCTENLPRQPGVARYLTVAEKAHLPKGAQSSPSFWQWFDDVLSPEGRRQINEAKDGKDIMWKVQRLYQLSLADYQRRNSVVAPARHEHAELRQYCYSQCILTRDCHGMTLRQELEKLGVKIDEPLTVVSRFSIDSSHDEQVTWGESVSLETVAKFIAEKTKHILPMPLIVPLRDSIIRAESQNWEGLPVRYIEGYAPGSDSIDKRYDFLFRRLDPTTEAATGG